jgi:translation initiation factor IF-1
MVKPLKAGGEVDSWCTKCKLVLNHRIIAMVGTTPVRVECSTCNSHHNFRARAPGDKATSKTGTTRAASAGPRSTRGPTKAQQVVLDRERTWEKSIAGKGVHDFRPYRVSEIFDEGDLVRHSKFGDGVVTRLLEGKKVEVLFKDDARTLAHGLTD